MFTFDEIYEKHKSVADKQQAVKMSAYMRDKFAFLGVPKSIAKPLIDEFLKSCKGDKTVNWQFVFTCWDKERELQYLALEYICKFQKTLTDKDIENLKKLVITKSWWETVDCLDAVIGDIASRYPELDALLLQWSVDENIWLRRVAIDHQQKRKEKTNTELLEKIIVNNFGQTEFFINKAIGWSLREYSKVNKAWVKNFVEKYKTRMAPLSVREASKYL